MFLNLFFPYIIIKMRRNTSISFCYHEKPRTCTSLPCFKSTTSMVRSTTTTSLQLKILPLFEATIFDPPLSFKAKQFVGVLFWGIVRKRGPNKLLLLYAYYTHHHNKQETIKCQKKREKKKEKKRATNQDGRTCQLLVKTKKKKQTTCSQLISFFNRVVSIY